MRFVTLIVIEGDSKRAIAINMDHVIKVDHDESELVIHLSNGDTHYVDDDSKDALRKLLNDISIYTQGHPDH